MKCESARHLQPGECPSRGLFHDCEIFGEPSFEALVNTEHHPEIRRKLSRAVTSVETSDEIGSMNGPPHVSQI